jgi:uncharacterized damage-inducible protein DinB
VQPSQAIALVSYNEWANRKLLAKAAAFPVASLKAKAPLSHGSFLDSLLHILDTQWYWREGAQFGLLPAARLVAADFSTLASLRQRWAHEDKLLLEFTRGLSSRQLNSMVSYSWPRARLRSRPLWHILIHIVNHGTHHRGEIGRYMATLGKSPGDMDFVKFISATIR